MRPRFVVKHCFVPEGHSIIAQQFTAGATEVVIPTTRPVGTAERYASQFNRPYGTDGTFGVPFYPAMNRWAIVQRPSGSKSQPSVEHSR